MPYHVPTMVAVTTALAAGGAVFGGETPPPGALGVDLPVDRTPQTIAGGGSYLVTWPAMGASEFGQVVRIGISTTDAVNTRTTTRVDGVAVDPYQLTIGAIGSLDDPTLMANVINLKGGQVFSLLMENLSGGNIDMAARTMGWRSNT